MSDQYTDAPDPSDPYGRTPAELAAIRRRQFVIAGVLSAIVVAGVVLAVVFAVVLNGSAHDPVSPEDAAQQWAEAVLGGNNDKQRHLECADKRAQADVLRLITVHSSDISTKPAQSDGAHHWTVEVDAGGTAVTVGVEEQNKRYLVC